ncbi:MAG: hypothetical protein H0W92_04065 [Sphingomonas sp.]|nr:hypothetical protein [Sphingomonas sp.]
MGVVRGLFLCSALVAATAVVAQPASPPTDQSTIVVTGERSSEQDMQDFVRALTPASPGGQLSRFEQSVCPSALGLPLQQRDAVVARMRRIAREAGIAVGGANCSPNVVVMVTQDKAILMRELRRKHSQYFGQMSQRQIRALIRQPGPAVAWQLQGPPMSARGMETFFDPALGAYVNRTTEPGSRLAAAGRPQFDGAVVVVERGSLTGLTVTQLADYAAMRAFAGTSPSRLGESGTTTILRILEAPAGSEVPLSLTAADFAFLRGFYSVARNLHPGAQRSAIGRSMKKDAERRAPE